MPFQDAAGECRPDRLGLSHDTATGDIDGDIDTADRVGDEEEGFGDLHPGDLGTIGSEEHGVDPDDALAGLEGGPGDCRLAFSACVDDLYHSGHLRTSLRGRC